MIYIDDSSPPNQGFDMIIPFTISDYDQKLRVEAYPETEETAREFIRLFADSPFSDAALEWLNSDLHPLCERWGYETDEDNSLRDWSYAFSADTQNRPDVSVILPSTQNLEAKEELEDILENTYINNRAGEWDSYCYSYAAFGSIEDGKIVSLCSENSHFGPDDETELGIETAFEYRRRGYAASNLSAITAFLLDRGQKRVWYKCSRMNIASAATAKKAGLRLTGRSYNYIAYLKGNE